MSFAVGRAVELEADMSTKRERPSRLAALGYLLDWLEGMPGRTWQQRWLACRADQAGAGWVELVNVPGQAIGVHARRQLAAAAGRLVLLGALRPAYNWLYRLHARRRSWNASGPYTTPKVSPPSTCAARPTSGSPAWTATSPSTN